LTSAPITAIVPGILKGWKDEADNLWKEQLVVVEEKGGGLPPLSFPMKERKGRGEPLPVLHGLFVFPSVIKGRDCSRPFLFRK